MITNSKKDNSEEIMNEFRKIFGSNNKDLRSLLYRQILTNSFRCQKDNLDILDLKVLSRVMAEFRYAACVFKPYRQKRKVSIFGSARTPEDSPYYQLAVELGRKLAEAGFMVITGAADGIMKAGIEGAGPGNSFGVDILLPFEEGPSKIIKDDPKVMRFKYFFTRKLFFVMEADAFALFPGGFGTHDEGFEVLTLLQTGKSPPMPVILMELHGETYWETWDRFVRKELLDRNYVSSPDLSFYKISHSPEEAVESISSYYSVYHSIRQVRDKLVIRLNQELPDATIAELNRKFGDIIKSGNIIKTLPLPDEEDEPELLSQPRITFDYNKKSAGRLNQMILEINEGWKNGT